MVCWGMATNGKLGGTAHLSFANQRRGAESDLRRFAMNRCHGSDDAWHVSWRQAVTGNIHGESDPHIARISACAHFKERSERSACPTSRCRRRERSKSTSPRSRPASDLGR
jgi:hypothetical protein